MNVAVLTCLLVLLYCHGGKSVQTQDEIEQTCENEEFVAECPIGQVIIMKTAVYGRMQFGKCIDKDYGYLGCQVNVLNIADRKCSGQQKCTLGIPDPEFGEVNECPRDLKPYLEASYTCQKVITVNKKACHASDFVLVTTESGYLSSWETEQKQVGSADCPWMLQVASGQRLQITLVDFDTYGYRQGVCHAYAIMRETARNSLSKTICSEGKRIVKAYTTKTNKVEIRVISSQSPKNQRRFLLKFEALGCSDPPKPVGGWVIRKGNQARLGCTGTDRKWVVTCTGNEWKGAKHSCYNGTYMPPAGEVRSGGIKLPIRLSIVLIVSTALLIGILVLFVGLLCLRWQRQKNERRQCERRMDEIYGVPPAKDIGVPLQQDYITYPRESTIYTQKEGDPTYSSENDYAYISDLSSPSMFDSGRQSQGTYESCSVPHKYCGPGTGSVSGTGSGVPRHARNVDRTISYKDPTPCLLPGEPPKYFELDPESSVHVDRQHNNNSPATNTTPSTANNNARTKPATTSQQQQQQQHLPIDDQNAYNDAVMTRVNKSIHDFGYCSPVAWTSGGEITDENHKSV